MRDGIVRAVIVQAGARQMQDEAKASWERCPKPRNLVPSGFPQWIKPVRQYRVDRRVLGSVLANCLPAPPGYILN